MLHKTCQSILLLLVLGSLLWGAVEPTVSPTPALPTTTREQTVTEIRVQEFGPVDPPAYGGTSAGIRSPIDVDSQ